MNDAIADPEALARDFGLQDAYQQTLASFPFLSQAITRFLSTFDSSTDEHYGIRFIDLLHRLECPRPTERSVTESLRSMVQSIVAATPSDAPLSDQWKEVRRTLLSDDQAITLGFNLSRLDELP